MGGDMITIIRKSEKARLTTRRFDGVRRDLVVENIYITTPLPIQEMKPSTPMTKPRIECHSGFIGGYWYLQEHQNATQKKNNFRNFTLSFSTKAEE